MIQNALSVSIMVAVALLLRGSGRATEGRPEALQKRIAELRAGFEGKSPEKSVNPPKGKGEPPHTIQALAEIIQEERSHGKYGAVYSSAVDELAKHPRNQTAVRILVQTIEEPPSPSPIFSHHPLETFSAAKALLECDALVVRHQISMALMKPQSDRALHLMAYVLAHFDQDGDQRLFSVDLTVLRLTRKIEATSERRPPFKKEEADILTDNMRRMVSIMLIPDFGGAPIGSQPAISGKAAKNR